jgi:hypothetical protein
MSKFNYTEELQIDPDALDVEWLMQPQLYVKYADLYVNAEVYYDRSKEKVEFIKATLDSHIRNNATQYVKSGMKLTESSINSIIITDIEYVKALNVLYAAKKTLKLLGVALKAFEQRKSALENLVKLHGQSYFASPNINSERSLGESLRSVISKREDAQEKIKRRMEKSKATLNS